MDSLSPVDVAGAGSRLLSRPLRLQRTLTGGQHAVTVLVTDDTDSYVVRAFPHASLAVTHEIGVLERLGPLGAMAPHLLAHGEEAGQPVIVTSALAGRHPALDLAPEAMAGQLADVLARIHRLDGTGLRPEPQQPAVRPGRLSAAAQEAWHRVDLTERVLTHFDFWCGNALWDADQLVGVVDWSGARWAPRGVDVAWCRQDLVLLGSPAAAEDFLHSYERRCGRQVSDIRAWDILAAEHADPHVESWDGNYHGIGRSDITSRVLRERLDAWTETLLS